jgi:outer membrane protein assembly factor BamB
MTGKKSGESEHVPPPMERRHILRMVGFVGISGIAGCSSSSTTVEQTESTRVESATEPPTETSVESSTETPTDQASGTQTTSRRTMWSEWRGNSRNTGYISSGTVSDDPGKEWSTSHGLFAPYVVTNTDTAFLMGGRDERNDNGARLGAILAVNTSDGSTRWRVDRGDGLGDIAATSDTVYVMELSGEDKTETNITALNAADGTEMWEQTFDSTAASRLTVLEDSVLVPTNNAIYRVNRDGEEVTELDVGGPGTYTVSDGKIFRTNLKGEVTAYNLNSGQEIWSNGSLSSAYNDRSSSSPTVYGSIRRLQNLGVATVHDGVLYKTTSANEQGDANPPAFIVAVDAETGELKWESEITYSVIGETEDQTPKAIYPPVAIDDSHAYVVSDNTRVFAWNLSDGSKVWTEAYTSGTIESQPLRIIGDKLLVLNRPGPASRQAESALNLVDPETGEETFTVEGEFIFSAKPAGDYLLVTHSDGILAIN